MRKRDVVLVTAVGNVGTGSQIVECLYHEKKEDTFLIGTDIQAGNIYCMDKLDRFFQIPGAADERYETVLEGILIEYEVQLAFIGSMPEAVWYYHHVSLFEKHHVKVVLGEKRLFQLCMDKAQLFSHLKERKIAVPRFHLLRDEQDCELVDDFPVILKPNRYAIASDHTYLAFDREDLYLLARYARKNQMEMLAQEWKGDSRHEYSVSVTHDFSGRCRGRIAIQRDFSASLSRKVTYKKDHREYIISSGITQGIVEDNQELLAQAERIADVLESRGPLNLQGIWEDNQFWLIDAHPAITGGAYVRALAGYNEPLFWKEELLHQTSHPLRAQKVRISRSMQVKVEKA